MNTKALLMAADSSRIQHLRSEILKGYSKSKLFDETCAQTMLAMTEAVLEAVDAILPGHEDDLGRKIRFEERVLRPAVDLAVAMKTSITLYSFSNYLTHESRLKQVPLPSFALQGYRMINIDTRETLRAEKASKLDNDGVVGYQVLLLAPGLHRLDSRTPAKRLTPDVVCVKVGSVVEQVEPHLKITDKASPVESRAESISSGKYKGLDTEMKDAYTRSSQGALTGIAEAKKGEPAEALKHQMGATVQEISDDDQLSEDEFYLREVIKKEA
ncbi:MAG: hypothetical protein Q9196_000718 [Gyalolechia fulgens]